MLSLGGDIFKLKLSRSLYIPRLFGLCGGHGFSGLRSALTWVRWSSGGSFSQREPEENVLFMLRTLLLLRRTIGSPLVFHGGCPTLVLSLIEECGHAWPSHFSSGFATGPLFCGSCPRLMVCSSPRGVPLGWVHLPVRFALVGITTLGMPTRDPLAIRL